MVGHLPRLLRLRPRGKEKKYRSAEGEKDIGSARPRTVCHLREGRSGSINQQYLVRGLRSPRNPLVWPVGAASPPQRARQETPGGVLPLHTTPPERGRASKAAETLQRSRNDPNLVLPDIRGDRRDVQPDSQPSCIAILNKLCRPETRLEPGLAPSRLEPGLAPSRLEPGLHGYHDNRIAILAL